MISAAERAATCSSDFLPGTKASAIAGRRCAARIAIRSHSSDRTWPQMLNGELRPAWAAIVRS